MRQVAIKEQTETGKKYKPIGVVCKSEKEMIYCVGTSFRYDYNGGEGGIRTLGEIAPTTVFETVPFGHSGTSPIRANILR